MLSRRRTALLVLSLCLFGYALPAEAEVNSSYSRSHNVSRQAANAIASGASHTCMRFEDGSVRCWGQNGFGQLGDGTRASNPTPVTVERFNNISLTGVLTITAGVDHTCALKVTGRVVCWGDNSLGQLGLGDSTITSRVRATTEVDLDNVVAIAAGAFHTCALQANSRVSCWGDNTSGQIGDNTNARRFGPTSVLSVGNFLLSSVRSIVAGQTHNCALSDRGTVRCWGDNALGQLGTGDMTPRRTAVLVSGSNNSRVTALAAGQGHTCFLRTRGELFCWGNNADGQLGDSTNNSSLAPTLVAGNNSDVVGISAGLLHTCAVISTGRIRCWGFNRFRQLGDNTTQDRNVPTDVTQDPFQRHFIGVAAGELHTCGLTVFHTAVCWGDNSLGQLGNGVLSPPSNPVTVRVNPNIGAIAVDAGSAHTCALRVTGRISCWGVNQDGELGIGTMSGAEERPVLIPPNGIPQALDLATGAHHTCAVLIPGRVRCWGRNEDGRVGDGTTTSPRRSPVEVPNFTNAVSVSTGDFHTCALTADGRVFCWGSDFGEALGNGFGQTNSLSPAQVPGITDAIQIDSQHTTTCALLSTGTALCWGGFINAQGGGTSQNSPTIMFDPVIAVTTGDRHRCGLVSNGTMLCAGTNSFGHLGDGTFESRTGIGNVTGINDAVLVNAGFSHSCAIRTSGRANCWGSDFDGFLGDGPPTPTQDPGSPTPREVVRLSDAPPPPALTTLFALSSHSNHSCAVQTNGAPFCWGRNFFGALGDGSNVFSRDVAGEVPSFRFNLAPSGSLQQGGKRAELSVLANCEDQAQAHIEVRVQQNAISAIGHATVQCTGALESYPVEVRAEDKGPLVPGTSQAEALITVKAQGRFVELLQWNRAVELLPQ